MIRKLTPELLDSLPHDDPGALRSRRDLRRINSFMGNDSWIIRSLPESPSHITEIGAGEGLLLSRISDLKTGAKLSAYDLAPRPEKLADDIEWKRGDILEQPIPETGGTLIANLFLHHFTQSQLAGLAPWLAAFDTLIINEPLLSNLSIQMAKLAAPFIHAITRHDMRVSIEAGFLEEDLPALLKLSENGFEYTCTATWNGGLRVIARKR